MPMGRIAAIQSMLAKTPDDVFLHYSLAMEYASNGDHAQAVESFRKCIELDGSYLPAYAEAGKSLRTQGRFDEAREIFLAGLDLANQKGERHMADYIRQQVEGLAE